MGWGQPRHICYAINVQNCKFNINEKSENLMFCTLKYGFVLLKNICDNSELTTAQDNQASVNEPNRF